MKILSQKIHGFIDYAAAAALIIGPFVLLPQSAPILATWLSVLAGVALVVYSLITDYSISARKMIPFSLHLKIDLAAGVAFVIAPFLFNFEGVVQAYYLVMGLAIVSVVLLTENEVEKEIPAE